MAAPKIPDNIAALVGTNKLDAAIPALIRKYAATWRALHARVVKRTGKTKATIDDANPKKAGNQKATISLSPASSDWQKLGAQMGAMVVVHKAGPIYLDELARMLLGQPVKKLEGDDADLSAWHQPTEREQLLFAAMAKHHNAPSNLDPVTLTVIGGIIIAAIPFVLPILFTLGAAAFKFVTENTPIGDILPGGKEDDAAPPPPPPPPLDEKIMDFFAAHGLKLGAAALALAAIVWAVKRGA